jgi:stage II sporulation protein D
MSCSARHRPAWATLIAAACFASAGSILASESDEGLRRLALAAEQPPPILRIGLSAGHTIVVSSAKPFRIVNPASGRALWRPVYSGQVAVIAEGGPEGEPPPTFRVQVGSFTSVEAAEAEKNKILMRVGEPATVYHDPDRGTWRVRVGGASDRAAMGALVERLRQEGWTGAWIIEESAIEEHGARIRLVDANYESRLSPLDRLAVVPAPGARIEVGAKPYRGVMEIRLTAEGQVRAINWVGLESYLQGVVPAELGPEVWPQPEALKAQAVAARTYAWKHRGQFQSAGYDLCATPRCQVYGGAGAEHPMSDRAVADTRGEILTWQDEPITAFFTATCGGHTESAAEIFPEEAAPYLAGVPCRAEPEVLAKLRCTLEGREIPSIVSETGEDVTRDWALLAVAGVARFSDADPEGRAPASAEDLRGRTAALAALCGRPGPAGELRPISHLGAAAQQIVEDLGWAERARVLVVPEDIPALLRDASASSLTPDEQRAAAYLVFSGALEPFGDGRFGLGLPPSNARLDPALVRIGDAYDAFKLKDAVFAGGDGTRLRLIQGKEDSQIPVGNEPVLFAWTGGRLSKARRLDLWPNDRVRFRTDKEGRIDFLEMRPPVKGTSDDRSAAVYSWEVRRSREELEEGIAAKLDVGRLIDLQVLRRGVSGRVVELKVVGSAATDIVKGNDVRRLLDLRESLTVIETQRAAGGDLEAVVFAGKGWGHGVGLCQVGAYGMALRGNDYKTVLGHYYPGTSLRRIDGESGGTP